MTPVATPERLNPRHISQIFAALLILLAPWPSQAQEQSSFDEIAAAADLLDIDESIDIEAVDEGFLAEARSHAVKFGADAALCAETATEERVRLEDRFEPLKDIDAEVAGMQTMDQCLADMLDKRIISREAAKEKARMPENF